MKKFLIILSALLLCITPFFAFRNDNILSVSAYDNTYNYTASISTDYSTTFLEGVNSVESVNFDYVVYYSISYPTAIPFKIIIDSGANFNTYSSFDSLFIQLNRFDYVDYTCRDLTNSLGLFGSFKCTNNYGYATITGTLSKVIITDLYVEPTSSLKDPFPYSDKDSSNGCYAYRHYSYTGDDLSQFIDMNSQTNFNFNVKDMLSYEHNSNVYNILNYFSLCGDDMFYCSSLLNSVDSFYYHFKNGNSTTGTTISTGSHGYFTLDFRFTDSSYMNYSYNVDYSNCLLKNFEIIINKPVNRLDNTLVLYNYDYDCAISSVSSIEYALSKDNDLYKAKYTGTLPNNKYIGVVSAELQNRIYDEYIYLYLTFNNNIVEANNNGNFNLGFDFNFSRYYEPFVIKDTDLNNYNLPTLNKPDDWYDFGGWIRYAFVWLLFYNPIIAPISKFIVSIFGVFINVIKFILGFELGTFLLAFIGFIIIYNFFVSISPIQSAWKGVGALDNALDEEYRDYKDYREKTKPERVHKKKVIKRAKRVNKIKKENFKKLKEIHDTKSIRK